MNLAARLAGFVKDAGQGACAGFLSFLGATHITGAPTGFTIIGSEASVFSGFWEILSVNGLAGPIEILGGIVLFFAARRTIARTFGLLSFIGFIAAYANGYSLTDMLALLSGLLVSAADILQSVALAEA